MPKREKKEKRLAAARPSGTNIPVSVEVRDWLVQLKHNPYEPYDMVLRRMVSALKSLLDVKTLEELRLRLLEYEPNEGVKATEDVEEGSLGGEVGKSSKGWFSVEREVDKELRRLRG